MTKHAVVRSPVTHGRLESLGGVPYWYHRCGEKMNCHTPENDALLCIRNKIAVVEIFAMHGDNEIWNVKWNMGFRPNEKSSGNRHFTTEQMECAFGLKDSFTYEAEIRNSNIVLSEFGGTVAYQGRFIRWQNCLNIPGPGTGHDGCTTVSIYINSKIRAVVREMIRLRV